MNKFDTFVAFLVLAIFAVAVLAYLIAHAPLIEDPQPESQEDPAPATGGTTAPVETAPMPTRSGGPSSALLGSPIRVRIAGCTDKQMWYAGKVGHEFTPEGVHYDVCKDWRYYWTREDTGYRNIVLVQDTEVVK